MNAYGKFMITETEPVPLIGDFKRFLEAIEANPTYLTPKGCISGRSLFEINQRMTHPLEGTTVRTGQEFYPQLHLFFHLAQAGRLIQKELGKANKIILRLSNRAVEYLRLTPTEKYFFLLETFWVDTDWNRLEAPGFNRMSTLHVHEILAKILGKTPGVPIRATDLISIPDVLGYFWIYFATFGFWTVTRDMNEIQWSKRNFRPATITPLPLGIVLASLLFKERQYPNWNLSFRRKLGQRNVNPGQPLPEEYLVYSGAKKGAKARIVQRDQSKDPFFLPFVSFFPEGELSKTLPREVLKPIEGVYLFHVSLSEGVWRKIELSSDHTLLDLHYAIQNAYHFDDDHLYSFFMDGVAWSDEKFTSPNEDEGPYVDEVTIGELGLVKGQAFLYLFDYGDEWRFRVALEEIRQDKPHPKIPRILKKKGKSPRQYPNWE